MSHRPQIQDPSHRINTAMILHLAAFLLLQLGGVVSQTHQISGIPSPGNTIHVERELTLSYNRITIKVSSVVPVTVQRYGSMYDSEGEEAGEFDVGQIGRAIL
jgi:hypothetical protein